MSFGMLSRPGGKLDERQDQDNVRGDETFEAEDLKEVPLEYLQSLDIPDLYRMIHVHLDQRGLADRVKSNIGFKRALIKGWVDATLKAHLFNGADSREINRLIMGSEAGFIQDIQSLGVHVAVESELPRQELAEKPHLFMSTHQGGGLETYVLAELLRRGGVRDFRYVMKDELVHLPIVGKTIASRNPILVHRAELKDDAKRALEIQRIGKDIVEALARGENVLFFFEGTRSKSGAVAHTENRQAWCRQLNAAIQAAAAKYPNLGYGKALVVLDMLSVLPVAVEKKVMSQVRTSGDCTVKILDANGLNLEENPLDPYDRQTLYGTARSSLKETLIKRIQRYQGDIRRGHLGE